MSVEDPIFANLTASCVKKLLDLEATNITKAIVLAIQAIPGGQNPPAQGPNLQQPKAVWSIFNQAIAANTNFVVAAGSSNQPLSGSSTPCIFRIYVALSAAGIFSVRRTVAGTTVAEYMNQGVALAANSGYIFDIIVDAGEGIDFQTTGACTILKMSVVEKDDAE